MNKFNKLKIRPLLSGSSAWMFGNQRLYLNLISYISVKLLINSSKQSSKHNLLIVCSVDV